MDQFKTRILNTSQLSLYFDKPVLIFYLKSSEIVIFQLFKSLDGFEVQLEMTHPIGDSLIDALDQVVKKVMQHSAYNRRAKVNMLMADCYLTMHRCNLNNNQLRHIDHSLEIEIDHIGEYEYGVSFGPSEVRQMRTVLIYLIKKNNLHAIEAVYKSNRLLLRRIVSRYHAFESLFEAQAFDIDSEKVNVLIDISENRVRLFIVLNYVVKVYRRMPIRLSDSKKNALKLFESVLSDMSSFIESSIESYLLKYSDQSIDAIYLASDAVNIPSKLNKYKIQGIPLHGLTMTELHVVDKSVKDIDSYMYAYGFFLMSLKKSSFNLIPFMKRFEWVGFRAIGAFFAFGLLYIVFTGGFSYYKLNKEYSVYRKNQSQQLQDQTQRKREMVELRDRINQQKKIIDYSDLTSDAYSSQISIDEFLYTLTSISSQDISFDVLRIRNKKINISGTCSSLNGSYSFYSFIQQLEKVPYLGQVKYNLGLGGGVDLSLFSIEVSWMLDE